MSIPPVAIVTGAGSGIGQQTSLLLADRGYRIALIGRTESRLHNTETLIVAEVVDPPETLILPADMADAGQAASIVDVSLEHWGRVDVIVNNAAIAEMVPLADTDADLLYRTFAANTFGPIHAVARLWPVFKRQGGGCIVNVSSVATVDPMPGLGVYAATKAALESLTRSIMNEAGDLRIRAFSILPGAVETAMLRGLVSEADLPPTQTLDPAEIAEVIVQCIEGERDDDIGRPIVLPSP